MPSFSCTPHQHPPAWSRSVCRIPLLGLFWQVRTKLANPYMAATKVIVLYDETSVTEVMQKSTLLNGLADKTIMPIYPAFDPTEERLRAASVQLGSDRKVS